MKMKTKKKISMDMGAIAHLWIRCELKRHYSLRVGGSRVGPMHQQELGARRVVVEASFVQGGPPQVVGDVGAGPAGQQQLGDVEEPEEGEEGEAHSRYTPPQKGEEK